MYRLVLLSVKDKDWSDELSTIVSSAMKKILQRDDTLNIQNSVPDDNDAILDPVVVAYLGSELAAKDKLVISELRKAEKQVLSILPIVRSGDKISEVLPDSLRRLNAITWDGMKTEVALRILELFGIIENKRRLFLSYRRDETNLLALQLCRSLSERRFDVFLDRFSVPPGDDFQRRIDIELTDKSFVLLLESKSASDSPWVQHEVCYALAHYISVLAITMPGTPSGSLFGVIDEAFRYRLQQENFKDGSVELSATALNTILDEVELRCARQIRRRRTQLLGSLNDWLFQAGFRFHPVDDWAVFAEKEGESPSVLLVIPRCPTPADLREVDLLRRRIPGADPDDIHGYVVHSTEDQDPDNHALVEWTLSGRPLATRGLDELPILWGL